MGLRGAPSGPKRETAGQDATYILRHWHHCLGREDGLVVDEGFFAGLDKTFAGKK